jgi:tricorn protease
MLIERRNGLILSTEPLGTDGTADRDAAPWLSKATRLGDMVKAIALAVTLVTFTAAQPIQNRRGYYRFPTLFDKTVVFTAEGDLWQVPLEGGVARRLTTHLAEESQPRFSPDGKQIAYAANYEGINETYTIPAGGGMPRRRTFGGAQPAGWTPDGRLLVATTMYSAPPDVQLVVLDDDNRIQRVPLSQASQGAYDAAGKTLFFTRLQFQGSHAKRYKGGTAQKLWKFVEGGEAVPLVADYAGTSRDPMYWQGRVYFTSDRDGTMNLWSMDESGRNLRQHTRHQGWDVKSASLSAGRIVYQLGADLRVFEIASGKDSRIEIELSSDFDHLRERWIKAPSDYVSYADLSPDGSHMTFVSRGRVFVTPVKFGRLVEATAQKAARYRAAVMLPGGKELLVLSTESGEVEVWKIPANGVGRGEQLTTDGKVLRWDLHPSPDGKYLAHTDKDNQLWLMDLTAKTQKLISTGNPSVNSSPAFGALRWSPDSRWLSYTSEAKNTFEQIWVYSVETGVATPLTTDRYNSTGAAWSADGKYIYFLSDRALRSVTNSPWGPRQPDPFFDRSMKIYQLALKKGLRSPFEPPDELNPDKPASEAKPAADAKPTADAKPEPKKDEKLKVEIDLAGISSRIEEVPQAPGNYTELTAPGKRLCWITFDRTAPGKNTFDCLDIANKGDKPDTVMEGVRDYQVSADGKKMMIRKGSDIFVVDSSAKGGALKSPDALNQAKVDLKDWTFSVIPTDEFREAFVDAWRLHRDYFYDSNMHGVDWRQMRDKYGELVGRVRDRAELNDLIAQMVSELSVLHTSVVGGDQRQAPDRVPVGTLGAQLDRDSAAGGWVVRHIYRHDPDRPDKCSPLARPTANVSDGDVIVAINGADTLAVAHPNELLRNKVGKQVLLRIKPAGKSETRDVLVKPISTGNEYDLRYHEWEYTRRLEVEKASGGRYGYIHLRAMGPNDIAQFVENYYPVFDREGLIVDVRHNGGGNIDSWILGKLMRKAWMYWQPRKGRPSWNMQYAFRGHMVMLVDEWTGSDGEAVADGFKRLGLGKVIGTRTWGGEVWLTGSNVLADQGIATAAELGVFGPENSWLIEGHGVDPDIVVDNPPHSTFLGKDLQLEAALKHLDQLVKLKPVPEPKAPPYPDKSFKTTSRPTASREP